MSNSIHTFRTFNSHKISTKTANFIREMVNMFIFKLLDISSSRFEFTHLSSNFSSSIELNFASSNHNPKQRTFGLISITKIIEIRGLSDIFLFKISVRITFPKESFRAPKAQIFD